MSLLLAGLAFLVAGVAALRSTWSPCGRSMLSTITPIGERGRRHRYRSTAAWFVAGGFLGGVSLGAAMAGISAAVAALGLPLAARGAVAALAAFAAAASDASIGGFEVPIHRRQVNELWLDTFRPWFYGLGFGWQIGFGLATYITTAAVYLTVVLSVLAGSPLVALGAGAVFGLVRGASVLFSRHVTSPDALRALHSRVQRLDPGARRAVVVVEVGTGLALLAAGWLPGVVLASVALLVLVAAAVTYSRRARTASAN